MVKKSIIGMLVASIFLSVEALSTALKYEFVNLDRNEKEQVIGLRLFEESKEYTPPWTDDLPAKGTTQAYQIPLPAALKNPILLIYCLPKQEEQAFKNLPNGCMRHFNQWKKPIPLTIKSSNEPVYQVSIIFRKESKGSSSSKACSTDPFGLMDDLHNHIVFSDFLSCVTTISAYLSTFCHACCSELEKEKWD